MKNLSRGAWIAIAAAIAVPTTYAVARGYGDGWHRMSSETRMHLNEGKIAGAKAALNLSAEQEKLWEPVEAQMRTFMKDRQERRAERQKRHEEMRKLRAEGKKPDMSKRRDMAARLDKMTERAAKRAERLKDFSEAFKPFYASLSDEQKDVLRQLARRLMPGMRGHHRGRHWAHGGWRGGHHGHHRGHHGWGGRHGGPGPMMDSGGPAVDAPEATDDAPESDK